MKHYYLISPVLWIGAPGNNAATVYAIDRVPHGPLATNVTCTPRYRDDPAYWWSGSTFLRLTKPAEHSSCCSGPENISDAIVWQNLPAWISYVNGLGYTIPESCKLDNNPNNEFTLIYNDEHV
jgi:hypothetical protein